MPIRKAIVRQVSCPLTTPYKLSSGDLTSFDPFILQLIDDEGRIGWGECLIIPGYTDESIEESWAAANEAARALVASQNADVAAIIAKAQPKCPGIASTIDTAIEMLKDDGIYRHVDEVVMPLLAPCQGHEPEEIRDEVESLLAQGYRTLKVKVGFDWREDLARIEHIQSCLNGRGSIRLDANRGFNEADGRAFASRLAPAGIELFEQPCGSDDWQANARVAEVSTVPVMLDESIYGLPDIERAAAISNVGFVKLKLKKLGGAKTLEQGLRRITALGMTPILGDGVSMDLGCWFETVIGHRCVRTVGEMNGFLKTQFSLFRNPMPFRQGAVHLPAGYWPEVDEDRIASCTLREQRYSRHS
ncbi:mandelate racemase/muconate lactonizing enzyme family protein [Bordetella sp. 15P40C-2]|uniref:mandelate racemase/muconate lactonizing enzyme family protein n=1 Tax=Bordetella sp. 15P40C-2 TaxID=2572246 RepID=UPI001326999E|nr:enolase C-terminal domain-like protein [Bordetella sp. 15P40C-2]MVW73151.1 mandelate racemase [Bordetella sp. 15P40C-2]